MLISDFAVLKDVMSPYLTDEELDNLAAIVDEDDVMLFDLAIGFAEADDLKSIASSWRTQSPEEFKASTYPKILSGFTSSAVHFDDEDIRFDTFRQELSDITFKEAWHKEWDVSRITIANMKAVEDPSYGPYACLPAALLELYAFSKLPFILNEGYNKWSYAIYAVKNGKVNTDFLHNEHLLAKETDKLNAMTDDCVGFIRYLQEVISAEHKEGRVGRVRFLASAKSPRKASCCFNMVFGDTFGFAGSIDGFMYASGTAKECDVVLDLVLTKLPGIKKELVTKNGLSEQEYLPVEEMFV